MTVDTVHITVDIVHMTVDIVHIILGTLIHSSFCVPSCRLNFTEFSRAT